MLSFVSVLSGNRNELIGVCGDLPGRSKYAVVLWDNEVKKCSRMARAQYGLAFD